MRGVLWSLSVIVLTVQASLGQTTKPPILSSDQRLAALAAFVASWEAEHGEITDEQMRTARSRMSERAVRIRRPARERPPTRRAVRR